MEGICFCLVAALIWRHNLWLLGALFEFSQLFAFLLLLHDIGIFFVLLLVNKASMALLCVFSHSNKQGAPMVREAKRPFNLFTVRCRI